MYVVCPILTTSPRNIAFVGLNVLFLVLPFAWASHFMNVNGAWPHQLTFARTSLFVLLVTRQFMLYSMFHNCHSSGEDVRLGRRANGPLPR